MKTLSAVSSELTRLSRVALGLLLWSCIASQARATTIDFSTAPGGGNNLPFSQNGFTFTELGGVGNWQAVNITIESFLNGGGTATVRLTRTDGGFFDLSSLDVTFR